MHYRQFPEGPDGYRRGFPVETPLGVMYLNPVGWGVLVDNSSSSIPHVENGPSLTVRGRRYRASIGVRNDGTIERAFGSRFETDAPASRSALDVIAKAAQEAVSAWSAENPDLTTWAAWDTARIEYEGARNRLDEAKATLAELKLEVDRKRVRMVRAREKYEAVEPQDNQEEIDHELAAHEERIFNDPDPRFGP